MYKIPKSRGEAANFVVGECITTTMVATKFCIHACSLYMLVSSSITRGVHVGPVKQLPRDATVCEICL